MERLRLGVVLGGTSAEHNVSVASGMSVYRSAVASRYELTLIAIAPDGRWLLLDGPGDVTDPDHPGRAALAPGAGSLVAPVPGTRSLAVLEGPRAGTRVELDVVFPVLHGPGGEDGTVQGLLELMDLPYVGADVLGSAVGMDKDVMKRLAAEAGIQITPFLVVRGRHWDSDADATVANVTAWCEHRGLPVFVKPANLGSSMGISRVLTTRGIREALIEAFHHDRKVIVEKGVDGREIEAAVLGGDEPDAAPSLGEVIPDRADFYSFDAKYMDGEGARTVVPAVIDPKLAARIRALAVRAFRTLECWGMARVDFFVERDTGAIVFNEINTIPGFTAISMYAGMWEASGLPYPRLVDRLVDLAIGRHAARPPGA
jgi:D-alanine-D-alanine ligase